MGCSGVITLSFQATPLKQQPETSLKLLKQVRIPLFPFPSMLSSPTLPIPPTAVAAPANFSCPRSGENCSCPAPAGLHRELGSAQDSCARGSRQVPHPYPVPPAIPPAWEQNRDGEETVHYHCYHCCPWISLGLCAAWLEWDRISFWSSPTSGTARDSGSSE